MSNEPWDENCGSNQLSNLHCMHKTFFSEMSKSATGTEYCCWCGEAKKDVIPPHGPYYHGSCTSVQ